MRTGGKIKRTQKEIIKISAVRIKMQIGEIVTKFEWQQNSRRGPKFWAMSEAKLSKEMLKKQ